jgi:hypothetical protein
MVAVIHKILTIVHGWHDLLVRGDMDRNYYGAKFSTLVSVVHQSSWKFSMYLYFIALLPEHHLHHAIIVHIQHLLMGRNKSSSEFCAHSQMFCNLEFVKWILLLVLHHSSPTISIAETIYRMHVGIFFICKIVRHFNCRHTATQHSHSSLDSVQEGTSSSYAVWAHSTNT